MKILVYTDGIDKIEVSGLGKSIYHQIDALKNNGIEYTLDSNCTDYDIVHINWYNLKGYRFAKKAHKLGKKVVFHAHSTKEDFRNSFPFSNVIAPAFKKWISHCYKQGDYIVTPSDYSKQLLENYHLDKPIYAVSNGVDMDAFQKDSEAGKEFRKDFNFNSEDKIIMGVGLYFERKGILEFVELAKRMPEYEFIWFGYNPPYMSPSKVKKAMQTKLPNLHFPGYVEPEILKGAYSGADLFVFPTKEETEGIPILEAFSCKIDTLVSDIPVFDWIERNKQVYKAKNIDEFERSIKAILERKVPSLVDNAYSLAKEKECKKVGKRLISIYHALYQNQDVKSISEDDNIIPYVDTHSGTGRINNLSLKTNLSGEDRYVIETDKHSTSSQSQEVHAINSVSDALLDSYLKEQVGDKDNSQFHHKK